MDAWYQQQQQQQQEQEQEQEQEEGTVSYTGHFCRIFP